MSERFAGIRGKIAKFALAGFAPLAIVSCAPSPTEAKEKFQEEDYRYKITIEVQSDSHNGTYSLHKLVFYTNDEPVLDSSAGHGHLKATNAICPQSQNVIAAKEYLKEFGCAQDAVNFEISTPRRITVITRNQG